MRIRQLALIGVAVALSLGTLASGADASDRAPVRMNQIQLLGTHNSYHREVSFAEKKIQGESDPDNLWYSHASLPVQLDQQPVRQLELDVMPDSDQGGLYTDPLIHAAGRAPSAR